MHSFEFTLCIRHSNAFISMSLARMTAPNRPLMVKCQADRLLRTKTLPHDMFPPAKLKHSKQQQFMSHVARSRQQGLWIFRQDC